MFNVASRQIFRSPLSVRPSAASQHQWGSTSGRPNALAPQQGTAAEEFAAELKQVQAKRPSAPVSVANVLSLQAGQWWSHPSYAKVAAAN